MFLQPVVTSSLSDILPFALVHAEGLPVRGSVIGQLKVVVAVVRAHMKSTVS